MKATKHKVCLDSLDTLINELRAKLNTLHEARQEDTPAYRDIENSIRKLDGVRGIVYRYAFESTF